MDWINIVIYIFIGLTTLFLCFIIWTVASYYDEKKHDEETMTRDEFIDKYYPDL